MFDPPSPGLGRTIPALDRQILAHSRRWLLSGMYLRCTACGTEQKASESNRPFVHDITCMRFTVRDYPWHELACILHWVPSQNAVEVDHDNSKLADI